MKHTYQILDERENIVEYFRTLSNAKSFCYKHYDKPYLIVHMRGNYFGEGWRTYILKFNASKLVFNKVWSI